MVMILLKRKTIFLSLALQLCHFLLCGEDTQEDKNNVSEDIIKEESDDGQDILEYENDEGED